MTNEMKIEILQAAADRAFAAIADAESSLLLRPEFANLLQAIEHMDWMIQRLSTPENAPTPEPTAPPKTVETTEPEKPVETREPKPDSAAPSYKIDDVRAALVKAKERGVNVTEIIQSFGAEVFRDLSPDQYPAVMAKLEVR